MHYWNGRERGCIHQPRSSTSVFTEFLLYFSRFSTYVRTYIPDIPVSLPWDLSRLFCLVALFPTGTVEEGTLFPSGPPSRSTTSSNDSFFFLDNLSWYSLPSSSQIVASRLYAIHLSFMNNTKVILYSKTIKMYILNLIKVNRKKCHT